MPQVRWPLAHLMDLLEDPIFNEGPQRRARCFWYAVVGESAGAGYLLMARR